MNSHFVILLMGGFLVLNIVSAEECFSCTAVHNSFQLDSGTGNATNSTHTTPFPGAGSSCSNRYQVMSCPDGVGCGTIQASVFYEYESRYEYFDILYLGCAVSSALPDGCTYDSEDVRGYLLPYKEEIDREYIGGESDWDNAGSGIYGSACRCSGNLCNDATYAKATVSLVLVALIATIWNTII